MGKTKKTVMSDLPTAINLRLPRETHRKLRVRVAELGIPQWQWLLELIERELSANPCATDIPDE